MPNRNYINGSNFERSVKKYLESKGFLCFRTAGSHGLADVIVIPKLTSYPATPKLIQCKKDGKITASDLKKLKLANNQYMANFILAQKQKGKIPLFKSLYGDEIKL